MQQDDPAVGSQSSVSSGGSVPQYVPLQGEPRQTSAPPLPNGAVVGDSIVQGLGQREVIKRPDSEPVVPVASNVTPSQPTEAMTGIPLSAPSFPPSPMSSRGASLSEASDLSANDQPLLVRGGEILKNASKKYQQMLDATTPLVMQRWVGVATLFLIFFLRILYIRAYYIVCYVLCIFALNQLIYFLQPKDYSSLTDSTTSEEPALPTKLDEFRPFVRKLPEFKFWYSLTKAVLLAILATFNPVFNVPVYWPVLVVYFFLLFFVTMRRQFMDMKRFKYVPWDIGKKKRYKSSVSVTKS
mmetsp:Transcript_9105/g.40022  ORF Transcript_9105/g.40022 Transcript_9105/m.40022 type:complete len:298 (-) Transcript_9105:835-1728(-)|eukprot:CAMPEP_0113972200 /NCGR_PEP_ID=MMETSP0011_2-20120614/13141_1 /TAXON_ID=101924 /ORGANISM="Rhodosorus marinus" /LENGTH=297 /DNA_ID=CAMNT_0000988743 /DNA_START=93 /DNA_END=986 /DNA_ORIENTATION=- /assembly_acc=CAM_ASM_000156